MLYFGADYYPEHWPRERWAIDARMMREAGFNVVRLAEFAWVRMETPEGRFTWDWLDEAIATLASQGIAVVLGTPTATPPIWLCERHPDIFRQDEFGHPLSFGARQHASLAAPAFLQAADRVVRAMAEHYASNPHVIGWQIDNELGGHGNWQSFDPHTERAWHAWLASRYGAIDALNRRWGTVFWSQEYQRFDQVPPPRFTPASHSPSLLLDWRRFCSDTVIAFQQRQIDLLRRFAPGQWVTHNLLDNFDSADGFRLCANLDFASWDNYPNNASDPARVALMHRLVHGLKRNPFWVMEQRSGQMGWEFLWTGEARPGDIARWAYQAIAHGANGIVFFRWRTCRFGTEEYWHGILNHDGRPNRRLREVSQMGHALARIGDRIAQTETAAPVALLHDYENRWALGIQPHHKWFDHTQQLLDPFRAFWQSHISVDLAPYPDKPHADVPARDLSAYSLVIAPVVHLVRDPTVEALRRYAEQGGLLVLTFRSGVKNEDDVVRDETLPGPFGALAGIEIREYDVLFEPQIGGLEAEADFPAGAYTANLWCDILEVHDPHTQVLLRYTQEYYAGQPAVTIRPVGRGHVVYIGCQSDAPFWNAFAQWAGARTGIGPLNTSPAGVEVARRGDLTFVLNHTAEEHRVALPGRWHDLLAPDDVFDDEVFLEPRAVRILAPRPEAGGINPSPYGGGAGEGRR